MNRKNRGFFFFKQKTAYEMRISDWSSDVCSSDLMTVTITGSEGFSVVRNMRNGESHELGATNPAFRVEPGEYTITVDGNGAAAGAFAFRLLDLGSADRKSTRLNSSH